MIYVGIDVASKKHDYFFMNDKDVNANIFITINNDLDGFEKLEESIRSFMKHVDDKGVRIGLESTGHYSHNILHYLVRRGFDTMLINPRLTNMERVESILWSNHLNS